MANPTVETPAGPQGPQKQSKPGIVDAVKRILTQPDEADESKVIAQRRRFVMAGTLGFLGINFLMFLRFFFPRALYETKTKFVIGYPSDFCFGVDTKFKH